MYVFKLNMNNTGNTEHTSKRLTFRNEQVRVSGNEIVTARGTCAVPIAGEGLPCGCVRRCKTQTSMTTGCCVCISLKQSFNIITFYKLV